MFIRNSTRQRDGLNMVSRVLEEHLKKVANITLERVPSQAKELLGMAVVNTKETANKDNTEMEPTNNQMENKQEKQYQEMLTIPVRLVRDVKVPPGTMKEILV